MDPIINDERTHELKEMVREIVTEICSDASMHDFRVVDGPTHTNLIFDVVLPRKSGITEEDFKKRVDEQVKKKDKKFFTVINIDRSFAI